MLLLLILLCRVRDLLELFDTRQNERTGSSALVYWSRPACLQTVLLRGLVVYIETLLLCFAGDVWCTDCGLLSFVGGEPSSPRAMSAYIHMEGAK